MKKTDYLLKKVWQNGNNKKWYWNAKSTHNGEIVGSASQGFSSKQNAIRNAGLNGFTP